MGVKLLRSPSPHLSTIASSASSGSAGTPGTKVGKSNDNLCATELLEVLIAANETFLSLHTRFLAYRREELNLLAGIIFAYRPKNADPSSLWPCLCLPK